MEFKDVIHGRRAVNFFDPARKIPAGLLRQMVETAALAPSSFNLQPWQIVLVTDAEDKARLRKLAWDQPKVDEAPVVMLVLADRSAWQEGHPFLERNFKEMVAAGGMPESQRRWFLDACRGLYGADDDRKQAFALKNAGFFAASLMLAAKDLGLDTHPMDGFDHEGVKQAFRIPEQYWIPLLLAVGYFRPDTELQAPKWRKSYDEIVIDFR